MISRIDQQLKVNRLMIDYLSDKRNELVKKKRLYQYMKNYLEIITTVSSILLIRSGTEENLEKKAELWKYLKEKDRKLYRQLRHGVLEIGRAHV